VVIRVRVNLSTEKNYFIIVIIFSFLAGIPYIGSLFGIIAIILMYLGFKGYEEKLGLKKPKELYVKSIIASIIGVILIIGLFIVVSGHSNEETVHYTYEYYDYNYADYYEEPGSDEGFSVVLFTLFLFWVVEIIATWYSTLAFVELGHYFGIKEFETYRTAVLALYIGLPLWIILSFLIIGLFVMILLAVIALVYYLLGISKLPSSWEKEETTLGTTSSPIIY